MHNIPTPQKAEHSGQLPKITSYVTERSQGMAGGFTANLQKKKKKMDYFALIAFRFMGEILMVTIKENKKDT